MDINEVRQFYLDLLTNKGFEVELDKDGDIRCRSGNGEYLIWLNAENPSHFRMVYPNFWPMKENDTPALFVEACLHASSSTKVAKVCMLENNVEAAIELFCSPSNVEAVFDRCISAIDTAIEAFADFMRKQKQQSTVDPQPESILSSSQKDANQSDCFAHLNIDMKGWNKDNEDDTTRTWVNDSGDIASQHFFDVVPNLVAAPIEGNMDLIRQMYREMLSEVNGGIICIEPFLIDDIPALETIIKVPQKPNGMTYVASLTLPFEKLSYVIKFECPEHGTTGIRDSTIRTQLYDTLPQDPDNPFVGWFIDPYDSRFDDAAKYNQSDRQQYDQYFPAYPLSRARGYLRHLKDTLVLSPTLKELPIFNK